MSLLALTSTLDPKADSITPEKQLSRLALPIAQQVTGAVPDLIPVLADLVGQYALDECFTNWYTAYDRLGSLPKKVRPLHVDIYQIMYSACPIYSGQVKGDGEPYLVKDTHFLALVSEELGSLNKMEKDVLKPYGERTYSKEENPLQFRYFLDQARQEHADAPFPATHFILFTNDVLPGSRRKPWDQQVALVDALSQKARVKYEIPTLQQSFTAITTDMVATGERRYRSGDDQNQNVSTYTCVKETTNGYYLAFGGSTPSGVGVGRSYGRHDADTGVAAVRKF